MSFDHDVIVLGGGISGLTVAHTLVARGLDVQLYDRRPAVGGRIQTIRQNGFLVENGPTSMITPAPAADCLLGELGLTAERIGKSERVQHRYLVRDGRVHALSMSPAGFFTSSFFSLNARFRLLVEPFVGRLERDESIADFVTRRFGREMLDYVFDPLVGGLYTADPRKVSAAAIFPQLKKLERDHGSVVGGVLARRMHRSGGSRFDPRRRTLQSLRDGMASLPACIESLLGKGIASGVRAEGLAPIAGGGYRVILRTAQGTFTRRAREVVLALPAYAAARLVADIDNDAATFLGSIAHPPVAVVGLGYRRNDIGHPLDGLGVLNPSREQCNTLGLMFSSSLFAGRAPEGHELITAYVGGSRQPELAQLPREELLAAVGKDVHELLDGRGTPVFTSIRYWRQGLPQPTPGHVEHIAALRSRLAEGLPGLHLAGNYLAGVSTVACIDAALAAAAGVAGAAARPVAGGQRRWV